MRLIEANTDKNAFKEFQLSNDLESTGLNQNILPNYTYALLTMPFFLRGIIAPPPPERSEQVFAQVTDGREAQRGGHLPGRCAWLGRMEKAQGRSAASLCHLREGAGLEGGRFQTRRTPS